MTIEEVKDLIKSARSIKRETARMKQEIEARREELMGVKSSLGGAVAVKSSVRDSMPERVYFQLEKLYIQYSEVLQRQFDKNIQIECEITKLDPIEQEIVRAWIDGKTEEQIGNKVGYSDRSVRNYKRRILVKLADVE